MDPTDELHAIDAEDEDSNKAVLPFQLSGIISHLNVEPITSDKWDQYACPRVKLTHKYLTWNPSSTIYEEQENTFVGIQGKIVQPAATVRGPLMTINSVVLSTCVEDTADIISEDNFGKVLQSHVNGSFMSISKAAT